MNEPMPLLRPRPGFTSETVRPFAGIGPQVRRMWNARHGRWERIARGVSRAFTLIEIVIVVAIVFVMAFLAIPTAMHAMNRSQVTRAIKDIEAIEADIDVFELETG